VWCVFESLLIGDCFQAVRLETKAALRWLGRCKGSLHYRASILVVREGYFVVLCGLWCLYVCCVEWGEWCVFQSLLIGDLFQGARLEAKASLRLLGRCKGTLHCRASTSVVREGYVVFSCWDCVIESLLIWGLFSGCEIGSEGCVALAGALQGHSALQSIDLYGAWGIFCCVVWGAWCVCLSAC